MRLFRKDFGLQAFAGKWPVNTRLTIKVSTKIPRKSPHLAAPIPAPNERRRIIRNLPKRTSGSVVCIPEAASSMSSVVGHANTRTEKSSSHTDDMELICNLMSDAPSVALGSSVPGFRFNRDALPHMFRDYPELSIDKLLGPGCISMVIDSRKENRIAWASESFLWITQYLADELLDQSCCFLRGPHSSKYRRLRVHEAIKNREQLSIELLNYRADGSPFISELEYFPLGKDYYLVVQKNMMLLDSLLDHSVCSWHPIQVEVWLHKRRFPGHVREAFVKHNVSGAQLVAMTPDILYKYGVEAIGSSIMLNFVQIEITFRNQVRPKPEACIDDSDDS